MNKERPRAASFDFGQTLAELDHDFLKARLAERGASFDVERARQQDVTAWQRYGELKGQGHAAAWRGMIEVFLQGGGVEAARLSELGSWLWEEQRHQNLWRRPIPGMIELCSQLHAGGCKLAVISNSEGFLAELVAELDWTRHFDVIVDSGKLGIDKPQPGIFQHACAALGVPASQLLHVGDSWQADVEGALGVSAQAVWFDARHRERELPSGVYGASSARELAEVLARLGLVS